jgi:hypothetical protein
VDLSRYEGLIAEEVSPQREELLDDDSSYFTSSYEGDINGFEVQIGNGTEGEFEFEDSEINPIGDDFLRQR